MARSRRVSIAALNIALHAPHSAESYVNLLKRAFASRVIVQLGSLHAAMLGSLGPISRTANLTLVHGEIYRFVKLDPKQPWFNIRKKEPASQEEVGSIKIPRHLLPHLQRIPFIFNTRNHRLWYISKDKGDSLAPKRASKFLQDLLQSTADREKLPPVSVTALPEKNSVEEILSLPRLEYLRIELVRPNPDDAESAEERWLRSLEEQNTARIKVEYFHAPNQALEPNAETKEMASVAANNGVVYGRGRSAEGLPIEDSTTAKPMVFHDLVDSDNETVADVLYRRAVE